MISLRDITEADAGLLYMWKDDAIYKEMASHPEYINTVEKQQEDIECAITDPDQDYKLILLDNEPIGYIRVGWYDYGDVGRVGWISYALGTHRGCGHCRKALNIYFDQITTPVQINATVYTINLASQQLLEGLGFKRIHTYMKITGAHTYSLSLPR